MKYLLDTCVLLWALEGKVSKLGNFASLIQNENNIILVSVVSYWEIVTKESLGKLQITGDLLQEVEILGFLWMNMEIKHIEQLKTLPAIHHDPFDRLLIAQSYSENIELLTYDQKILQYL